MSLNKQSRSLIRILSILLTIAGFNTPLMVEARTLQFGHYADSDFTVGKTASQFATNVKKWSGGGLIIDLYPRAPRRAIHTVLEGA